MLERICVCTLGLEKLTILMDPANAPPLNVELISLRLSRYDFSDLLFPLVKFPVNRTSESLKLLFLCDALPSVNANSISNFGMLFPLKFPEIWAEIFAFPVSERFFMGERDVPQNGINMDLEIVESFGIS